MKITTCNVKTKCDFTGCASFAKYDICHENEPKRKLVLCENCAKQVYSAIGTVLVPKSLKTPFKKAKKLR